MDQMTLRSARTATPLMAARLDNLSPCLFALGHKLARFNLAWDQEGLRFEKEFCKKMLPKGFIGIQLPGGWCIWRSPQPCSQGKSSSSIARLHYFRKTPNDLKSGAVFLHPGLPSDMMGL